MRSLTQWRAYAKSSACSAGVIWRIASSMWLAASTSATDEAGLPIWYAKSGAAGSLTKISNFSMVSAALPTAGARRAMMWWRWTSYERRRGE